MLKIKKNFSTLPPNRPPTFSQSEYTFQTSPSATVLGTVTAEDADMDHLNLSIEPSEYSNLFHVDSTSGRIGILTKLEQPRYSFLVVATDEKNLSAFTNVKVTVSSESADTEVTIAQRPTTVTLGRRVPTTVLPPVIFSEPVYSWKATDKPVGSIIGQVLINRDETQMREINFSLISGEHLSIDSEGRVAVVKPFEERITDMVIVTRGSEVLAEARVEVVAEPRTTMAPPTTVTQTQQPTTQEPLHFTHPIYHASAPEGSYISGLELDITPPLLTNYPDAQYSIEDPNVPFYLNSDGKKLVMFDADHEKQAGFLFSILATSGAQTAHARVNVTILDVNDNAPVFKDHLTVLGVLRSKHVGAPVYQLKADDPDNGIITYELRDPNGYFSIDEREGMIRVLKDLQNAPELLKVTVVARDSGVPQMTSEVPLTIQLFKSGTPTLPDAKEVVISEAMAPGAEVAHLLAGPLEERIQYRVTDKTDLFEIDPQGTLRLSRKLQEAEKNQVYRVNITAEHPETGDKDQKELKIFVDSGPGTTTVTPTRATCQFSHPVYRAQVKENSPLRSAVVRVQAGCQGAHTKFRYAFHVPTCEFFLRIEFHKKLSFKFFTKKAEIQNFQKKFKKIFFF